MTLTLSKTNKKNIASFLRNHNKIYKHNLYRKRQDGKVTTDIVFSKVEPVSFKNARTQGEAL
jgi:hypothetical protein